MQAKQHALLKTGLYEPAFERDNCGFGMIAHIEDKPSHGLLTTAIEALERMTHRGGISADGKSGDGCGLLLKKPEAFFRAEAQKLGFTLAENYAVGLVFFHTDNVKAEGNRALLEKEIIDAGLEVAGWRVVPTNKEVLGRQALEDLPQIKHVFVNAPEGMDDKTFNAKLFVARRRADKTVKAAKNDSAYYVASLSSQTLSYKGLVMPADLDKFYLDLSESSLETSQCVFHQRFSTNTFPQWRLAQPFRYLAHNGEINTIRGNRNWAVARSTKFETPAIPDLEDAMPLVNMTGSDSSSMDNMLEALMIGGMETFQALRTIVPPAWQNNENMDADMKAFYEYNSMHMEPWDGPAGIVLTDGRYATCALDRNGLRPSRWVRTNDGHIMVASEIGVYNYQPEDVIAKGRLKPGEIMAIDTQEGKVLDSNDIDEILKARKPYKKWLDEQMIHINHTHDTLGDKQVDNALMAQYEKMFQLTFEERDQVLRVLAENAIEATGAMGDDTPMAVLSKQERPLYDYFRQQFAQVTNPPIDPIRESVVMSLETCLGAEHNVFAETAERAHRVSIDTPILSPVRFNEILEIENGELYGHQVVDLNYDESDSLEDAIQRVTDDSVAAIKAGKTMIILSDRNIAKGKQPIHALLATGAVHHRLITEGLRCDANIIVETATARDAHHMCVLIGYGATAVYPYLAFDAIADMQTRNIIDESMSSAILAQNYVKGLSKGMLKILSKMGISTIASYRGSQLFEIVGLDKGVVQMCFKGTTSRINGASFEDLHLDQSVLAAEAWNESVPPRQGGKLKYIDGGEYHAFNPTVVEALQDAVNSGEYADWKRYADAVNNRPVSTLRDLFELKAGQSISIDEVEPVSEIVKRFDSAAISLGALSPEAHETLAEAMNRLGARSNSGEGGEDPARYGTEKRSKIKQIASGRFGVTPHYLVNAEVLQIKVAQGAKPGEGGQLPGEKVNDLIARLRYSVPGVTLISPPPHHDIYSIEDLAQLIFDLKQVNPEAKVSVKLVSEPGVGTIAAGVAKAYADLITISGYDGGTGASPLTSVHYAGSPFELGLAETHQTLRANELRDKVTVQADGGLKTGLDVFKAAIFGAESFGFGTAPMIAMGCRYLRICHLNNCAVGVATQNDVLRLRHFKGDVEKVMNYFLGVAQEIRELMASVGVRTMNDLIGRYDLLEQIEAQTSKQEKLDLMPLISDAAVSLEDAPNCCGVPSNIPFDKAVLARRMVEETLSAIENKSGGEFNFDVINTDRSIGARISGEIAKRYGNVGMEDAPIMLNLTGTVGQSWGVWNAGGLYMRLEGDANDYVGKGMTAGKLSVFPPRNSVFNSWDAPIVGNTCLYGATGGYLFASGRAGERFGVRNSGAYAVTEGAGDHCCEYMTGGMICVLGNTGSNFGAGMTGGLAFVYDEDGQFASRHNPESTELVLMKDAEVAVDFLKEHIEMFVAETGSKRGQMILDDFDVALERFVLVKPTAAALPDLMTPRERAA